MTGLREMMARHARKGRVAWLGRRSERRAGIEAVARVEVAASGLAGDHARAGKRAVTLLQAEHLPVVAALLGTEEVAPERLRRNIVISGINLAAFRRAPIRVGGAVLLVEGPCPPCSRMEEELGPGGYSAVRGHGGFYASVIEAGTVSLGDVAGMPETVDPAA